MSWSCRWPALAALSLAPAAGLADAPPPLSASVPATLEDVRLRFEVDERDPRKVHVKAHWAVRARASGAVVFGLPLTPGADGVERAAERVRLRIGGKVERCLAQHGPEGPACVGMATLDEGERAVIEASLDLVTSPVGDAWGPQRLKWPLLLGGDWTGRVDRVRVDVDLGAASGHTTIEAPGGVDVTRPERPRWDLRQVDPEAAGSLNLRFDVGAKVRHYALSTWNATTPLGAPLVDASSVQADPENPRAWEAMRAADRDPTTSWCEGVPGGGEGEWIDLSAQIPARGCALTGVAIVPGWPLDEARWRAYGRPSRVRLGACTSGPTLDVSLPAGDWRTDSVLLDTAGLPADVTCVRVTVLEVHPGARLDLTCLAEVAPRWSCGPTD